MTFPILVNKGNRIYMSAVISLVFLIGYLVPNHFHFFKPVLLTLTDYDRAVPFLPTTIFIYMSEYVFFIIAFFLIRNDYNRSRFAWSFFGSIAISSFFFFIYPTTYPRADFPLPTTGYDPLTLFTFSMFRMIDDPSNTLPSMHVSSCFLGSFCFLPRGESKKLFFFTLFWAVLVALSTLTTKQHYIVDVVSGIILAGFCSWYFYRRAKYVPKKEFMRRFYKITSQSFG